MASFNQTGFRQGENEGISDGMFRTECWLRLREGSLIDLGSNPGSMAYKLSDPEQVT